MYTLGNKITFLMYECTIINVKALQKLNYSYVKNNIIA